MIKPITLKFTSSGIQSDIYYLTTETFSKLQDKDIRNMSPLEYIQKFADKEFNSIHQFIRIGSPFLV